MDFGLNETQELIRSSAAEYLSDRSSSDFVRAMATDEQGYTEDFWREIGELGWLGLIVPEEHGGSGMDMSDMAVLLGEWGAALAPGPLVESAVVSASTISEFGSDVQKQEWLPSIAAGETVAVPSLVGMDGSTDPSAMGVRASETSNGWVISGKSRFVPYGNSADLVLMPAETDAGVTVFAVPIKSAEGTVNVNRVKMASGAPASDIELNEVVVPTVAVLGESGGGSDVVDYMMYLFAIVFFWTPPHFWALSLLIKDDYERAGVPMMPVVAGESATRLQILLYTVLLLPLTTLFYFATSKLGLLYLVSTLILGVAFFALAFKLWRSGERRDTSNLYKFSLLYLFLLFVAVMVDATAV